MHNHVRAADRGCLNTAAFTRLPRTKCSAISLGLTADLQVQISTTRRCSFTVAAFPGMAITLCPAASALALTLNISFGRIRSARGAYDASSNGGLVYSGVRHIAINWPPLQPDPRTNNVMSRI